MKKKAEYKFIFRCAATLAAMASFVMGASCHNAKEDGSRQPDVLAETRPDESLANLMKAISDGDAHLFARCCVFPIQRHYPLRNIEDSITMLDYFPVMIDDSLRNIARHARLDDWKFYGWRGWAFGDSTLLWFDDGLQFVDYESKAERGLRKMLAREEIMSLLPELRQGWTPVETLVAIDSGRIFRIDSNEDDVRLMEYDSPEEMRGRPALVLVGSMQTEGSAGYRVYVFSDSAGTKAEYMPDAEPPVKIDITRPGKAAESHKVRRAYWRDLLR